MMGWGGGAAKGKNRLLQSEMYIFQTSRSLREQQQSHAGRTRRPGRAEEPVATSSLTMRSFGRPLCSCFYIYSYIFICFIFIYHVVSSLDTTVTNAVFRKHAISHYRCFSLFAHATCVAGFSSMTSAEQFERIRGTNRHSFGMVIIAL